MFSVIIPLYNKQENIAKTVESVLSQTYQEFELIIVNDGSTDNSLEVVKNFNTNRLKLYSIENSGVSAARNYGIGKAKYPYIALLDADDYWRPNYLALAKEVISTYKDVQMMAFAYYRVINGINEELNFGLKHQFDTGRINNYFELMLLSNNSMITSSSVIISKLLFNKVGLFNEKLKYGEDLEMWFRLLSETDFFFVNKNLVFYNFDGQDRACDKFFDLESDLVFHLDVFSNLEKRSINAKKYLDLFRLQKLKTYHLNTKYSSQVRSILLNVDKDNLGYKWKLFYSLPVNILRPLYHMFFYLKHKIIKPAFVYLKFNKIKCTDER
ncbi:glycosyltransferase family 2 protein [Fulvivirga sediminis]|uniref:Glycosyltransferase n=1 Tax=Fulvivirga sediminis TaxID=2803949 RepID=A0A937JZ24_9BACT|nr:glycosyltransferase [Fulvivirga sediminis]MBL3654835.1 glycosyltransferase [Fulvivirga sediminis]